MTWHEAGQLTANGKIKAPEHVIAAAKVDLKNILRQPIQIVKKIEDKGYPTSDSDYLPSHKLAEAAEKSIFGTDAFNKLEEFIHDKLPAGQLLGTHREDGSIEISSIVPEKFISEVAVHEDIEHKLMQADGGTDAQISAKYKIININQEALNRFVKGETKELTSNGIAVAMRTPNFIFITKDLAPHQLPDLYHRMNTTYSGGSVSLRIKDGHVIVKNIAEEKRKHELAITKAGNNLSIQMHVQILKALSELGST